MSADSGTVEAQLRERLAKLSPTALTIVDESAKHAGHAGAGAGGGHYRLRIVAAAFAGLSTLARHRLVNDAVGDLLHGPIHALSIKPLTPDEV
jgi:BolA protein